MIRLSLFIPIIVLTGNFTQGAQSPKAPVFFVATNGNDGWSGEKPEAGRNKADGPFATLPRALKAVRDRKREAGVAPDQKATVFVRGGYHFLREPLSITPEDSRLVLADYRGEKPVLSGGR